MFVRVIVCIALALCLNGCIFAPPAGNGDAYAGRKGTPIIDVSKVTLHQRSETRFEVVGQSGSLLGPDRCIDAFVLSLQEFAAFKTSKTLPNRVNRVFVPREDSAWQMDVHKIDGAAAVALVPAACEGSGYSTQQLAAAVYLEFEDMSRAVPFEGDVYVTLLRPIASNVGRYLVAAEDASGRVVSQRGCYLSSQRQACLPLAFPGLRAPFSITIAPEDPGLSVSNCDVSTAIDYSRPERSCRFVTGSASNDVILSMWPIEERVDLKLIRVAGASAAGKYNVQTETDQYSSCTLSTTQRRCPNTLRVAGALPLSMTISHHLGYPLHTCLMSRGNGMATLQDGVCVLRAESGYVELVLGSDSP